MANVTSVAESDNVLITRAMRDFLNGWSDKPCDILFEDFARNELPSMMFQQLAGAEKVQEYVNGSYIAQWSFAVYIRVNARDTNTRFNAVDVLDALNEYITAIDDKGKFVNLPELGGGKKATKIEMQSTPAIASRYENGNEDYQAIFALEYRVKK